MALEKTLNSFSDAVTNTWVDALVHSQAVVLAWNNQGGRSVNLNNALKSLCFTTVKLGISLKLSYIPTDVNPADSLSRRLSSLDSRLHPDVWEQVQTHF